VLNIVQLRLSGQLVEQPLALPVPDPAPNVLAPEWLEVAHRATRVLCLRRRKRSQASGLAVNRAVGAGSGVRLGLPAEEGEELDRRLRESEPKMCKEAARARTICFSRASSAPSEVSESFANHSPISTSGRRSFVIPCRTSSSATFPIIKDHSIGRGCTTFNARSGASVPSATSKIIPFTASGVIQDMTPFASGRQPSATEELIMIGTQSVTAQVPAPWLPQI
jgi:hypothetical protein